MTKTATRAPEGLDILTPQEAADMLSTTPAALANLRYNGGGPCFFKLGRSVRYRRSQIEEFINGNTFERTDRAVAL